jgi:hypothetical protein
MANRPSDLAQRMSSRAEPSGMVCQTLRLPVDAARTTARQIINQCRQGDYMTVVEQWRQLPDGRIEFTVRRLRAID